MKLLAEIAAARPDEVALRDADRAYRWAEVDDALNRVVEKLLAADLGERRRVAVFAENAAETVLAHLGGLLGGASVVPVNFHLKAAEAAYILSDSGARALFVGPENLEVGLAAAAEAGVSTVVGWRCPERPGVTSWEAWVADASGDPAPEGHAPRPNLMYTSGTTGRPKGTELPPTMFAGGASITDLQRQLRGESWCKYGRHLVVGPLYHTGPLRAVRILGGGVPLVVPGKFDAEETLRAIECHAVESTIMVPTHFVRLLALPPEVRERYDVSSLRMVYHTGAACPIDVKRAMLEWWGPVLHEAYGATEVGTTCRIGPEEWLAHPGSVGRPVPPYDVIVCDDDGNELPAGETGRLFFRDETGRGVVYHNDRAKSEAAHLRPGVFTLGEIGRVDDEGYVYITDRFSDMIVSGGVNVYPAEAEQTLVEHPRVRDAACVGVPHPEMGEELVALVQPIDAVDPPEAAELLAFCRERLSHYKCPRRVELRPDLGRNAMGKVDKRALRASVAGG